MGDADFSPAVRRIVLARSEGRCEWCRVPGRLELHHRLYRSRGGTGEAGNAVALCGFGNASGCHGRAHSAEGERLGFSAVGDPFSVPLVLVRFGAPVLLSREGLVLRALESPCWAHLSVGASAGCRFCRPSGGVLWRFDDEKGWGL